MKAPIIFILVTTLLFYSCRPTQPNGKYLIYFGKTSEYVSNPFYSEQKSLQLKNFLVGREFDIEFKDDIAILNGYDTKKIIFVENPSMKSSNSYMRTYTTVIEINGFDNILSLNTSSRDNSNDLKLTLRLTKNNKFRDTSMVTFSDKRFAELYLKLKHID